MVVRNHSHVFNTDISKSVLQPVKARKVSEALCIHHYILIPLHQLSTWSSGEGQDGKRQLYSKCIHAYEAVYTYLNRSDCLS